MAVINGLEEQKLALKRVTENLKEVEKINETLSNIEDYMIDAKKKEYKLECSFFFEDETLKKIKIPVNIEDKEFVVKHLKAQKDEIVKTIKEDSSKHNISLTPQEEATLVR